MGIDLPEPHARLCDRTWGSFINHSLYSLLQLGCNVLTVVPVGINFSSAVALSLVPELISNKYLLQISKQTNQITTGVPEPPIRFLVLKNNIRRLCHYPALLDCPDIKHCKNSWGYCRKYPKYPVPLSFRIFAYESGLVMLTVYLRRRVGYMTWLFPLKRLCYVTAGIVVSRS
ncbi:hypothetical protein J6590_041093 [Homalodisca vitripennis]|nr:hypothetical protein J6590_041093 [Homalodisca vitripennis]